MVVVFSSFSAALSLKHSLSNTFSPHRWHVMLDCLLHIMIFNYGHEYGIQSMHAC